MERETVRELETVMERTGEIARKLGSKLDRGLGGELGEERLRELVWRAKISMNIFSPVWRARWKSPAARVDTNAPAYQQWKKVFGVELWSTGARQVSTRSRAQGPQYPNLECPPGQFCPICPNFVSQRISQTIAKTWFLKSY